MRSTENRGRELNEWRETTALRTQEIRIRHALVGLSHEQELVRPSRPMAAVARYQARFEIEERPGGAHSERRRRGVVTDHIRLDVALPIHLGAQDDPPAAGGIRDANRPLERALRLV